MSARTKISVCKNCRDSILSVKEDSTCHYIMEVGITALCSVPGFTQPKPKVIGSYFLTLFGCLTNEQISRVSFTIASDQEHYKR